MNCSPLLWIIFLISGRRRRCGVFHMCVFGTLNSTSWGSSDKNMFLILGYCAFKLCSSGLRINFFIFSYCSRFHPMWVNDTILGENRHNRNSDLALLYFQLAPPVSKTADAFLHMYTWPIKIDRQMREKPEEMSLSSLCTINIEQCIFFVLNHTIDTKQTKKTRTDVVLNSGHWCRPFFFSFSLLKHQWHQREPQTPHHKKKKNLWKVKMASVQFTLFYRWNIPLAIIVNCPISNNTTQIT